MNLNLHILHILDRVEGYGLSATTLRSELQLAINTKPGEQELRAALTNLRNAGLLITDTDDLTGDTLHKLTPAGTVRARQ